METYRALRTAWALAAGLMAALLIFDVGPERAVSCFDGGDPGPPGSGFQLDILCTAPVVPAWLTIAIGAAVTCTVYGLSRPRAATVERPVGRGAVALVVAGGFVPLIGALYLAAGGGGAVRALAAAACVALDIVVAIPSAKLLGRAARG